MGGDHGVCEERTGGPGKGYRVFAEKGYPHVSFECSWPRCARLERGLVTTAPLAAISGEALEFAIDTARAHFNAGLSSIPPVFRLHPL
jgi:hypothetical protein